MSNRSLLVVGVGNTGRGDDGVGPAVIDAIRTDPALADLQTAVVAGDLSDLVVTWGPDHDVIIVDAMIGGGSPGTIVTVDGLCDPLPAGKRPLSSHGFGLADTVALARSLGRVPRSLTIVAVEVGETAVMTPLTKPVRAAVAEVVSIITALAGGSRNAHTESQPQERSMT